jgi:glucose-6-phosphate isomerase
MVDSQAKKVESEHIWKQLALHQKQTADMHMRDLFSADPARAQKLSIHVDDLLLDYSKHRINDETLNLLFSFANSCEIREKISLLFCGEKINNSENRPALHSALRAPINTNFELDDINITEQVHAQLSRMREFVEALHKGEILGSSGKAIKKVINIGIGGSDLGPRLVVDALNAYQSGPIEVDFVSNLDPKDLSIVLAKSDPQTTMIIVVSKSFTTLETKTNADAVKHWLRDNGCSDPEQHFVAVTTNRKAAQEFGAKDNYIFYFWDWVGGRYSLWSTVGLAAAIAIGMKNFEDLLAGAHLVDKHFQSEDLEKNIPVILALLSVWYTNFYKAETHAVIPYDHSLKLLPEYLSQLVMESNGKSVSRDGNILKQETSPVIWGSVGTNAQHAYFQLLHQGTHLVPVDFLLPLKSASHQPQHMKLVSNCLAQSEALMMGQEDTDNPNNNFAGNSPSSTIVYSSLTPKVLGMLLAIYEHKTFVEAMLWDLNPFDQCGVELGKQLAGKIIEDISLSDEEVAVAEHDASTTLLMKEYLLRNKTN